MKQLDLKSLIGKYNNGTLPEKERMMLESWYIDEIKNNKDYSGLEENLNRLDQRMAALIQQPAASKASYRKRIAVAASLILIAGVGLFFYINRGPHYERASSSYVNDVMPGKVSATLTLANGKKIRLSDAASGEITKEAGILVTKTANGQLVYEIASQQNAFRNNKLVSSSYNTLSTVNGETYQVRLPDGTSIWLNAASTVSYPASFAGLKQRVIQLKGEAYLEVAKDRLHPFIVKTDKQQIEVLGTHFNVSAYANSPVTTTLAEGSVKVSTDFGEQVIAPGQQTVLKVNTLSVENADLEEVLAWKQDDFNFNSENIVDIMNTLSRWYDIEVIYQGGLTKDLFNGKISRNRNLSQVLKMLEQTKGVHFKIEGRRVTVMQ